MVLPPRIFPWPSWIFLLLFLSTCPFSPVHAIPTHPLSQASDVLPLDPPSSDLQAIPATEKIFGSVDSSTPIIPFTPLVQTLVLTPDGIDTLFSFSLLTELNYNVSDYSIEITCSNHDTIAVTDVDLGPPILMQDGRANYTANINVDRAVGETDITVSFRRPDRTIYTSIAVHYIICGISFYSIEQVTGVKKLIPGHHLNILSYEAIIQDNVIVCYAFIQYPDGSTSRTILKDRSKLPPLSDIKTSIIGTPLISAHSFDTCVADHASFRNGTVLLKDSCSFGFTQLGASDGLYFGVNLQKYRVGTITFRFQWDSFLAGTVFEELFETTFTITVPGSPPPAIIGVTPTGPFQRNGGQRIDCIVINAAPSDKFDFVVGNKTLNPNGAKPSQEGWTTLSYITLSGQGKNIPWSLAVSRDKTFQRYACPWAGEGDRFVFNYAASDITITSLSPNFGPIKGGTTITCIGFFGDIDISADSGDAVFIGAYSLEKRYIVSVTETEIVFILPPMQVVQSPSFEVGCSVIVNGIRSNEVKFMYESLHEVTIDVTGGSYDSENDRYLIPMCRQTSEDEDTAIIFNAEMNPGAPLSSLDIQWRIVLNRTREELVKQKGSLDVQSFSVLRSKLKADEFYDVVIVVSDNRYNTEVTTSIQMILTFSKTLGVGLNMDHTRTIANPPVDIRITAVVLEPGRCYGDVGRLSYEWRFQSVSNLISSDTEEVDFSKPSPRRLGREFMVPQSALTYGKHEVTVKVYDTDNPETYGVATANLNVHPAVLQAVIGSGESFIQASKSSDLEVSGTLSYDPDASGSDGLSYQWRCELSIGGKALFTVVAECPPEILPESSLNSSSFVVPSTILRGILAANQTTYVRYSLYVRKSYKDFGTRSSVLAQQVVELLAIEDTLTKQGRVILSTTDGRPVRRGSVAYYDPFVLSPEATSETVWRFRLLEPASDAFSFLKNPANLIHLPGYYSSGDLTAGRRILGLREGALQPDTNYKFEVEYESRTGGRSSRVEVSIRTIAKPTVKFLPLAITSGTSDTLFRAAAVPSSESLTFKYYFFIKLINGSEMCIDGCSGQRNVAFRVPIVGKHSIRCVMVDVRGKIVLDEAKEVQAISIFKRTEEKFVARTLVESPEGLSFSRGDHSTFEMESLDFAFYAKGVTAIDGIEAGKVSERVSTILQQLTGMYRKTQPNTPLGRDYLTITHAFASLPVGGELMTLTTFYSLCQMLFYAVHNTPVSERFDLLEKLFESFELLTVHAKQMHASGSVRRRLLSEDKKEINEALLELSELILPMTARVVTRSVPCGYISRNKLGEMATISVAAYCNYEQGSKLRGLFSTLEWCRDVFEDDGMKKQVFVLGEFQQDYISASGVLSLRRSSGEVGGSDENAVDIETQNMGSHSFVLMKTMIVEADMLDSSTARFGDMIAGDIVSGNRKCFSIQQEVKKVEDIFKNRDEVLCGTISAIEYLNLKNLNVTLSKDAYQEKLLSSVTVSSENSGSDDQFEELVSTSLATVNGRTFGVKRSECKDLRPECLGLIYGKWIPFAAVVVTVLCTLTFAGVGIRHVNRAREGEIVVEGAEGQYIERDAYGRDLNLGERLAVDSGVGGGEEVGDDEEVVFRGTPRTRNKGMTPRQGVRQIQRAGKERGKEM